MILALALALGLAACGGGGSESREVISTTGEGGKGDTSKKSTRVEEQPIPGGLGGGAVGGGAFGQGVNICIAFPLAELARQNGVKPVPALIANKVAALQSNAKDRKAAYLGCLEGIRQGKLATQATK